MSSELPTRKAAYGANQHYASQKHRALLTGDGRRMKSVECSLGIDCTYCRELSTGDQSVDASQNATGGVNVTTLVSPAQHCVAADARLRHHDTP